MSSFSSTSSTYIRNSRAVTTTPIFENNNVAALFASSSSSSNDVDDDNNSDADDHDENIKNEEEVEEEKKNEQNTEQEDAAERWKIQAKELREQIQKMEDKLPPRTTRSTSSSLSSTTDEISEVEATINELSYNVIKKKKKIEPASILDGKRILLVGANGRLGSMVCRKLLRTYPEIKELVAMVHVVGENSGTSRGYGRLSYEVGAEDGRGTINPAWDLQDRNAYFEFDEEVMSDYNLDKLRVVECEVRTFLYLLLIKKQYEYINFQSSYQPLKLTKIQKYRSYLTLRHLTSPYVTSLISSYLYFPFSILIFIYIIITTNVLAS